MRQWTEEKFAPAMSEWVVKLTDIMESDGWKPPKEILAAIKAEYSADAGAKVFELDGVSVDKWETEGWWANVRMSNTEPLVRLNLEGRDAKTMEEKRDEFLSKIRA